MDAETVLIERVGRGWVVKQGERRLEGRTLTPLLEDLLGRGDPAVMELTLDALEWLGDLDAPLSRDRAGARSVNLRR